MKENEYRIKEYRNEFIVQRFYGYKSSFIWSLLPLKSLFKAYYTPWFKEPVKTYRGVMMNGEFKQIENLYYSELICQTESFIGMAIFNTKEAALRQIGLFGLEKKKADETPEPIYHTVKIGK